ncbi:MAG: hypothetical protein H0T42_28780 [Deltaproteobacteria bacterium]|nr:hypothetical protein [Deltaproteobacteria bacterium]
MTRASVTRTWYRIALARAAGAPALVAAQGEHLGVAIAAAEAHVAGSHAIAVEVAAGDEVPLGESVGKHHIVELGDSTDTPSLRWPIGILPALGQTAPLATARRGWMEHPDPSKLVIEAQTDSDHLVDLFLGLVEKLPAADNLEVRVLDHFEHAGKTEVWLTSRVNAKKILSFLDDHEDELIHNGHIELSIYVRAHKGTLRLTEHKTVVWLAEERALEAEVAGWLKELEVPRAEALTRVVNVPHFHYRLAKTRDRKKLGDVLFRQRLRRVDTVRAAATGPREPD